MNAAVMQVAEGKLRIARGTLAPLAADPHGGKLAERAQALIEAESCARRPAFDTSSVLSDEDGGVAGRLTSARR